MQRYFFKTNQIVDEVITVTGEDVHHIVNVMRMEVGDRFFLCSDEQVTYLVAVTAISKAEVVTRIIEQRNENVEMPIFITLAQGIAKGDKFDAVVQKATECGISTFIPVAMKRSIAKIDEKKLAKKLSRWEKIALEATRQSHRQVVPKIEAPIDIKKLISLSKDYDVCFFAYEAHTSEVAGKLAQIAAELQPGMRVLALIGPEGGIDVDEVMQLVNADFKMVGLGPRIMRTETAPIYLLSALSYALEIRG